MALNRIAQCPAAYDIATRWRIECLEGDGSLFTPETPVWSPDAIEDLYERFVGNPDEPGDTFMNKFSRQLEGAPAHTIQLAGEALYIHLLPSMNAKGDHKRSIINTVLGWSSTPLSMPKDLADALNQGLYHAGVGFNTHRPDFLRFILELVRRLKAMGLDERHAKLSDTWVFRELMYDTPAYGAPSQRHSMLHLLFPAYFETIAAPGAKKKIVSHYKDLVSKPDGNIDWQLYEIRQALTPQLGQDFDFWADPIKERWMSTAEKKRWDAFIDWAKDLYALDGFDEEERGYKLEIATRLGRVREAIERGEGDWFEKFKAVFAKPYNLTHYIVHGAFLDWAKTHQDQAAGYLLRLWRSEDPTGTGMVAFAHDVPQKAWRGHPTSLISVLLMALDATQYPPYRATAIAAAMKMTGYPEAEPRSDSAATYQHALVFFDRILEEASERGVNLRDRLDAQSIVWWLTKGDPPAAWPEGRQQHFRDYRTAVGPLPQPDLVEPFKTIFADYEEAEWAFGLLARMADRLGLTGADDPRYSCSLRFNDRAIYFNYCNWLVAGFYAPGFRDYGVWLAIRRDSDAFGDLSGTDGFKTKDGEPGGAFVHLTIDQARGLTAAQLSAIDDSLDYMADRFVNYATCPYRRAHVSDIGRAVFDPEFRAQLLTDGIMGTGPEPYALEQMAAETGFPVDELKAWVSALERKKQAILYGPPGTGKTYVARRLARHLVAQSEVKDGFSELVQFHPAYAYEDFMQGIRPQIDDEGNLSYDLERGRFLDFIDKARECTGTCVLIIDEINRANIARVFGELMYLLEYRDDEIQMASGGPLRVPENVRLIGTMNTADRSIALVDHALRRRFAFLELRPQYHVLSKFHTGHATDFPVDDLRAVLDKVNGQIRDPHYYVGISFFLDERLRETIESVWRTEIYPYLDEYFFDQSKVAEQFTWEAVRPQLGL